MAFVQSAFGQGTTGTTRDAVLGSNVAVGELVVAYAAFEGGERTVVFSNSGTATVDSWTEVANLDQSVGGESYGQEVAYARVTGAGTLTVTATFGSAPAWGGIGVGVFDEMPNPIELQDSQFNNVSGTDPVGTAMTPTSQPAWVIGFGIDWTNTTAPSADTGAGFSDGGAGMQFGGSDTTRLEYQRITSTADIAIEFIDANGGVKFLNGLIFTEAVGGGGGGGELMGFSDGLLKRRSYRPRPFAPGNAR